MARMRGSTEWEQIGTCGSHDEAKERIYEENIMNWIWGDRDISLLDYLLDPDVELKTEDDLNDLTYIDKEVYNE
jgi:hypothetical protein